MDNKYKTIVNFMIRQMESGAIRPGQKMPSIRELAEHFACSTNTVAHAYRTLEQEHLVYPVSKSGYYMVEKKNTDHPPSNRIDFTSATPNAKFLPYHEFQHCLQQATAQYQEALFGYTDPQGLPSFRKQLQKYLQNHQIFVDTGQLCVITGAQQALSILTQMPFPNGKEAILVEQPTYMGMLGSAKVHQCPIIGIERSEQGIDLGLLENYFRDGDIKCFYTVPRFLNPLGISYSKEQKKHIVNLARKYNVYIVEDDYLSDLERDAKADPLYAMDDSSHVIYIKSFSKITMPGLRIGVAVLPLRLMETFLSFKRASDVFTSVLSQGAMEIYMKCGMFDRHVTLIRANYYEKMVFLKELCERYFTHPAASWTMPEAGIFMTLTLHESVNVTRLINNLRRREVYVADLDRHFLPLYHRNNKIKLCIINLEKQQIEIGIRTISEELGREGNYR
ncbi:PLP-dependent aminotransferase family protein [Paenibacillus tarimensis]